MRIIAFIVLWIVFFLSVPAVLHITLGSREYPLVSIGAVVGFVGGGLPSAWLTGLFGDAAPPQSR
jgi:hypothetical protein